MQGFLSLLRQNVAFLMRLKVAPHCLERGDCGQACGFCAQDAGAEQCAGEACVGGVGHFIGVKACFWADEDGDVLMGGGLD